MRPALPVRADRYECRISPSGLVEQSAPRDVTNDDRRGSPQQVAGFSRRYLGARVRVGLREPSRVGTDGTEHRRKGGLQAATMASSPPDFRSSAACLRPSDASGEPSTPTTMRAKTPDRALAPTPSPAGAAIGVTLSVLRQCSIRGTRRRLVANHRSRPPRTFPRLGSVPAPMPARRPLGILVPEPGNPMVLSTTHPRTANDSVAYTGSRPMLGCPHRPGTRPDRIAVLTGLYVVYEVVRGVRHTSLHLAIGHALEIVRLERSLHVYEELRVQRALEHPTALLTVLAFAYPLLHVLATLGILAWAIARGRPTIRPFGPRSSPRPPSRLSSTSASRLLRRVSQGSAFATWSPTTRRSTSPPPCSAVSTTQWPPSQPAFRLRAADGSGGDPALAASRRKSRGRNTPDRHARRDRRDRKPLLRRCSRRRSRRCPGLRDRDRHLPGLAAALARCARDAALLNGCAAGDLDFRSAP